MSEDAPTEDDYRFAFRLGLLFDPCAQGWTVGETRRVADMLTRAALQARELRAKYEIDEGDAVDSVTSGIPTKETQ